MDWALSERPIVVGLAFLLIIAGLYAFHEMDIEAYPDPVQPRIELTTQPFGYSAEEVEKLATIPLEWGLAGMRNLEAIRTISLFGLSDVKLYFSWDSDYYWDRTDILNRLGLITLPLPAGIVPSINPDNPIGEIYRYTVQSPDHNLMEEKEVEDWIAEKQFKTVPGIEDVEGFGGLTKEYHVDVDADKLTHYQMSLSTLTSSIANANINVGGSYLDVGEQALDVRGIGFIRSLDDIENITLNTSNATPVRVRELADVSVGYAPRLGIVGMGDRNEVVEGIVLMRKYGDTLKTLDGVEAKAKQLNTSGMLPKGFKLVPYYDRRGLVYTTLRTVFENLSLGMLLVSLVLIFFLGNLRTAIIAAINIPLAMFGAFILLYLTATPANLLSLGAVDFGIIIDSTIIVIENIYRHMTTRHFGNRRQNALHSPCFGRGRWSDALFDVDFHRCLSAVVHDERGRRRNLLPDVAYLCVRADHCDYSRGDSYAGAELLPSEKRNEGDSQHRVEVVSPLLSQPVCQDPAIPPSDTCGDRADHGRGAVLFSVPGRRVPAQTRRGEHLGPCDAAADEFVIQCR